MNDTDVQAPNTDCKPKLHPNYKFVLQILLVNNNDVPGSTKMLTQEHVALGKIRFCIHDCCECDLSVVFFPRFHCLNRFNLIQMY